MAKKKRRIKTKFNFERLVSRKPISQTLFDTVELGDYVFTYNGGMTQSDMSRLKTVCFSIAMGAGSASPSDYQTMYSVLTTFFSVELNQSAIDEREAIQATIKHKDDEPEVELITDEAEDLDEIDIDITPEFLAMLAQVWYMKINIEEASSKKK